MKLSRIFAVVILAVLAASSPRLTHAVSPAAPQAQGGSIQASTATMPRANARAEGEELPPTRNMRRSDGV
jgi:hypothetical protein